MAASAQGTYAPRNDGDYWAAVGADLKTQASAYGVGRFGFKNGKPLSAQTNAKFVKVNGKFVFHKM